MINIEMERLSKRKPQFTTNNPQLIQTPKVKYWTPPKTQIFQKPITPKQIIIMYECPINNKAFRLPKIKSKNHI
jgi:hypothetical protein